MDKNNISLWEDISVRSFSYPALNENIEVDVAIIGGGITGITAAFHLINSGKKVAIIEAHKIGGVTTSYSTGNLYIPVQPFYQKIYSKFNLEVTKAVADSRSNAINFIEKNIRENNIQCNFSRRPWFGYTADHERISLEKEVELLKKINIPIEYVNELPLDFKFKKAVHIPEQARFNPLQYVISMAEVVAGKGCQIFEDTRVIEIDEDKVCVLTTPHGKISAKKVLMATHTPPGFNTTQLYTAPYRSYVVSVKLKNNNYPEGHFWDLDRPPHATCTHADSSSNKPALLMVAGSHHKVGQSKNTLEHYKELETFLRKHFDVDDVVYKWSAQHYQSADNVPYIGFASHTTKNMYLATGYWADGLIYGTIAGLIIGNAIIDEKNPLLPTYKAQRFDPIASFPFVAKEGSNVFLQYLKDYASFPSHDYADLKPGEGKIAKLNGKKCAVSRDDSGKVHIVSAICTHMKCIVHWNRAEKTWDCPCHGSRFKQTGEVIEGPALHHLEKVKGSKHE